MDGKHTQKATECAGHLEVVISFAGDAIPPIATGSGHSLCPHWIPMYLDWRLIERRFLNDRIIKYEHIFGITTGVITAAAITAIDPRGGGRKRFPRTAAATTHDHTAWRTTTSSHTEPPKNEFAITESEGIWRTGCSTASGTG